MNKEIVTVLAEDFENNKYWNCEWSMKGCPIERAMIRAGLVKEGEGYGEYPTWEKVTLVGRERVHEFGHPVDQTVINMFCGDIPVETFSFEIETI